MFKLNDPKNNFKNVAHAFFLGLAITVVEPSTVLPLMVHHFVESTIVIGLFATLLRGGAIVIQLYAAFWGQSFRRVLPYLRRVFFFRFLSWFSIGLSIFLVGESNKILTITLIGIGLFFFSFSAGFGAIYFKELQAKLFSKEYRGKTMANRNIAGSIASIISGGVTGYVLSNYQAPLNYAYLFMVSSFLMAIGFIAFGTINEPEKENISTKEQKFSHFLKNAAATLKRDKRLQAQIFAVFLSFAYLLAMPFVILHANKSMHLTGWMLGGFISIQMVGSILGSTFLWRRISNYERMLTLAFLLMTLAYTIALFSSNLYGYLLIFLLFGIAIDGFNIAGMNLIIEIAPEAKRPLYVALQTNLSSIGLFFPILGGLLLKLFDNYNVIYILTIVLLLAGAYVSSKLKSATDI